MNEKTERIEINLNEKIDIKFGKIDERIWKSKEEAIRISTENFLKYNFSEEYSRLHKKD